MKRAGEKSSNKLGLVIAALVAVVVLVAGFIFFNPFGGTKSSSTAKKTTGTSSTKQETKYEPSQEEKDYLKNRFAQLTAVNPCLLYTSTLIIYQFFPSLILNVLLLIVLQPLLEKIYL